MEISMKPCPFCGCSMEARFKTYPSGAQVWEPLGWHDETCPLEHVLWCIPDSDEDEPWTAEQLAAAWNKRWNNETGEYE